MREPDEQVQNMLKRRIPKQEGRSTHLLYVVSHPIQYQAPLLSRVSQMENVDLRVSFSARGTTSAYDPGFDQVVEYDTPLLSGYSSSQLSYRSLLAKVRWADAVWIHGWHGRKHLAVIAAAAALRTPLLLRSETWEGAYGPTTKWRRRVRRLIHRLIDKFTTVHLTIGSENDDYWRAINPRGRHVEVPYAVDSDRFACGANAEAIATVRARLGLGQDQKLVLFAGKLSQRKLPGTLLEAFLALPSAADAALLFVGDGELRPALELTSEDHTNVHFWGFANQSELPALYGAADVFVLASRHEPWGLAVNEAMACGTAVIVSSDVGAAPDLVDPSVGRTVLAGDPAGLTRAIEEVLAESVELGHNAAQRISRWGLAEDLEGIDRALRSLTRGRE